MPPRVPIHKPYTGILVEPMPKYSILSPPADGELEKLIETKMKALFAHYGLDSTEAYQSGPKMAAAWANLAWHLARHHVPGFAPKPRGRGKPATRKQDDLKIVMHVELLKRRDSLSERKAIKCIAEKKLVPGTEANLLKRYKNVKKAFVPMVEILETLTEMRGHGAVLEVLEKTFSGEEKDSFLSSDEDCA